MNKLHTVYWQYHPSVAALPLVPTALMAIRQPTCDFASTWCVIYKKIIKGGRSRAYVCSSETSHDWLKMGIVTG